VGVYALLVNGMPVLQGFRNRYQDPHPWSPRPAKYLLFGSLGLNRGFYHWPDHWWMDWMLLALAALASSAFFWGLHLSGPRSHAIAPRLAPDAPPLQPSAVPPPLGPGVSSSRPPAISPSPSPAVSPSPGPALSAPPRPRVPASPRLLLWSLACVLL